MDVSVGKSWDGMVDTLVRSGRYASPAEVVEEGLRLVKEREKQLDWLRARLQDALEKGGSHTDEEVEAYLDDIERKLVVEGR
ncbi:type II toxin-antitoxin system ParD family antitoxin [Aureimonas leprariae]|uniref:Type II toxin-antitoxin system ParD family antitoxin n=1 Tax=Plantimonas leprariae TaxID=2615207 RepID=A0A7V7PSZ0_9HYPH|nr:type II toxin-antitoxin system ParD family antitoxin [Aureimonas leprariae]KAB0682683.1 type II toxin-antitoxin system ParD family antitoxin [Aureimonas leprariae]